ncbi:MAG: hypothetical protein HY659_13360 [Rhizobiales bacterium]|nr:hypothetical protein [Hyphomicrobiales bacterium]
MASGRLTAIFTIALLALFAVAAGPRQAAAQSEPQAKSAQSAHSSTPQHPRILRLRPRVRIYSRQPPYWDYPRPGTYSWPGPNAVRECRSWLEPEARVSGPVIVPRMRCWWAPG